MKVEKLDDEEEFEAEDVMDVIKAINDYSWVEAGDEGQYDGASIKATILGISYRYMYMHMYMHINWLIFIVFNDYIYIYLSFIFTIILYILTIFKIIYTVNPY